MKTDILQAVFHTIREYHMIEPGMCVIAGVSGGADSVFLLLALECFRAQTPFELKAVHVEHGLRGQESLEDAEFTERLCEKHKIPCQVVHADVRKYAEERGLSCEEAARVIRYRIFEEFRRKWSADRVAVAHHEGDQAETILWNLVRGSGLRGLCGIRPVRGALIRPLLFISRKEIEEFLTASGQSWRTDRTNFEPDFTRNRLRLSVLPEMERTLNAQAVRHIAQAGERLRQTEEYIEKMTLEAAKRCLRVQNGQVCLLLAPYEKEEPLIRRELLRLALQRCGLPGWQTPEGAQTELEMAGTASAAGESVKARPDFEAVKGTESFVWQDARTGVYAAASGGLRDFGAVHFAILERLAGSGCGKRCDLPGRVCAVREEGMLRLWRRAVSSDNNVRGAYSGKAQDTAGTGELPCVLPVPGWTAVRGQPCWRSDFFGKLDDDSGGAESSQPCCQSSLRGIWNDDSGGAESGQPCCRSSLRGIWNDGQVPDIVSGTAECGQPDGRPESEPDRIGEAISSIRITAELFPNTPELKNEILKEKKYTKWLSYDTMAEGKAELRTRRAGDYLIINAGGGKKKLKDYLIDCKIPRDKRDKVWLLANGSHILWVIGWRISEAAKVTPDTRQIVRIRIAPDTSENGGFPEL